MKDEEEFRTGIFSCGEKDYTFALKNFKFLIMDPPKVILTSFLTENPVRCFQMSKVQSMVQLTMRTL